MAPNGYVVLPAGSPLPRSWRSSCAQFDTPRQAIAHCFLDSDATHRGEEERWEVVSVPEPVERYRPLKAPWPTGECYERICSRRDGRLAYRGGLCQACYRAEPHQQRAAPGEGARLDEIRLPASWREAIELAAKRAKVSVAQWRREAYRGALLQQAMGDARLLRALQRTLES